MFVEKEPQVFKLIIFGDGGVGKTSLTHRYLTGIFSESKHVTIGVEFYLKNLVINERTIKLQIWDFGGEQRFRFLLPKYCRGCHGGLFLYDVTNVASLYSLKDWLDIVHTNAPDIPILVIGAKIDLVERRKVAKEEAVTLAKSLKLTGYAEVSAKLGLNIDNIFETITKLMLKKWGEKSHSKISLSREPSDIK